MNLTKTTITNPGPGIHKSKWNEKQAQRNEESDGKVKGQNKICNKSHTIILGLNNPRHRFDIE